MMSAPKLHGTYLWKVRAILPEPSLEPLEFVLVTVKVVGVWVVLRWCPDGAGGSAGLCIEVGHGRFWLV